MSSCLFFTPLVCEKKAHLYLAFSETQGPETLKNRHQVYEAAKAAHPERWNGRATRNWSMPDKVYLNPETKVEITNISKEKEAS